MRFRRVLGVLAMLCTQAVPSATTPAQEPSAATTTVFDGKYVGTATPTGGRTPLVCYPIKSIDMTIAGGQVIFHEILSNGLELTYHGKVNAAGEVSAFRRPVDAATMSGTSMIRDT